MFGEKVTVVIPVYNREKYIVPSITSVLQQTSNAWKLLIIDDASTDRTPAVVKRFKSQRIKYVRLKKNVGTGRALQAALRLIDTPYFMIVDSDDWIEPQTIEILLREIEKQPKTTSLVYGNTIIWNKKDGKLVHTLQKHRSFKNKYDFLKYGPMVYPRFFRTSAVRKVKGFESDDPHQGRYAEDRYLLLKLIAVSNFHWVDKNLYHLRRTNNDNMTNWKNLKYFAEVLRYIHAKLLKEWGNEYTPVYGVTKHGWLFIKELKKNRK